MNLQWYPGHMTKAKRMMQEDIKLIDVVIELVDARIPLASRNPDIDEMAKGKARIVLLNKFDLADDKKTLEWKAWFEEQGIFATLVNSKSGKGIKEVHQVIQEACKEKIERDRKRGIKNRPIRAMVVGIPNVGKSTFINSFARKACTKTGNKPGVTKGKQWIRLNKLVELLDTPGILWPKFEDEQTGLQLAFIGSIKDEIINKEELALQLLSYLLEEYQKNLIERYDILIEKDNKKLESLQVLKQIAKKRACLLKGGELDYGKAATLLLDEFRDGKIGKITLEQVKIKEKSEIKNSLIKELESDKKIGNN